VVNLIVIAEPWTGFIPSSLLGHANITTTQRYAHLADTRWDTVRDVLGSNHVPHGDRGGDVAPHLPHNRDDAGDGKVVYMDRFRRSTG